MTNRKRAPIQIPPRPCVGCRFYDEPQWNCRAFPYGIPDEIRRGEDEHREAFPGDGGIQFEEIGPRPEIPEPPAYPELTILSVEAWLTELQPLDNGKELDPVVRGRIREHIATARLWLDWMKEGEDFG